jgi:ABC-2 type transport system ATP-binding protein
MADAISVENIVKEYGKNRVVNGVSFNVKKGTIFGFLGPNGAGKTTTIKILTCQIPPTSGNATIGGYSIIREQREIKGKIGVVFENQNLYEELSVADNLDFFRQLYGADKKIIDDVLQLVEMQKYKNKIIKNFSKGMKQKIMIARALLNNPEILFLDEPTNSLDPYSAREIRKFIASLRDKGKTILLTTHNMEEADYLCDYLAFISKGSIIACDYPKYIKKKYGENSVQIETISGKIVESSLNTDDCCNIFNNLSKEKQILTIRSKEANLEDVFIKLTGEQLV